MSSTALLLLTTAAFCAAAPPSTQECTICKQVLSVGKQWYSSHSGASEAALQAELLSECASLGANANLCRTLVIGQHRKIFLDISTDSETTERTCIDIGSCDGPLSSSDDLQLVDWTGYAPPDCDCYNLRTIPVQLLVLHHTVTHTAWETLQVLLHRGLSVQYIAGHNGTVYQMVHDYWRAWHAGRSFWRDYGDLNSWAVGVEIVNTGEEPFPAEQLTSVIKLARMLVDRWHIDQRNIVAHFDIVPSNKEDPSGYFNWTQFYNGLGFFPGVFISNLTYDQQHRVLMNASHYDPVALTVVQQGLSNWGYKGNMNISSQYDEETRNVVQAFNRHWCPEIFVLEVVNHKTNVTDMNPLNQQWYGISQERLDKLLSATSSN